MKLHLAIALFLLAACIGAEDSKPKTVKSEQGRFEIASPVDLKESVQKSETKSGPVEFHIFSGVSSGTTYMLFYNDLPPDALQKKTADEMLANARDKAVAGMKGKLLDDKKVELDGYAGRDFRYEYNAADGSKMFSRTRAMLVKDRFYQVKAILPRDDAKRDEAKERAVNEFFESFKLVKN